MRLVQLFTKAASENPKKIAFISEHGLLSYEAILQIANICDIELSNRGVRENSTIVLSTNRPIYYIVFSLLASYRSLNIIFTKPKTITESGLEFDYLISTEPNSGIPSSKAIVIDPKWFKSSVTNDLPDFTQCSGDGGSFTHTSSGSTGKPKFIRSQESAFLDGLASQRKRPYAPTAHTRYVSTISISMSWALGVYFNVLIAGGTALHLNQQSDRLLEYIDRFGLNYLTTTPTLLMKILAVDKAGQFLKSLESVQIGGAYASDELLSQFMEIYDGDVNVGYGTTEVGGICNMILSKGKKKPAGYIGEFYRSDLEIAFFDDEMNKLPNATEGIVGFRQLNSGDTHEILSQNHEVNNANKNSDYFFPGDIMRLEGKSLFIVGRVKNIINVSGNKFSLETIQTVLEASFRGVILSCLSAPNDLGIEQLHVFYVASNDISLEIANEALGQKVGNLRISELHRIAEMPMTESGKNDVEALRKLVA